MVIVHVIGLPSAGKSTIVEGLRRHTGWPVATIGAMRTRRPKTWQGEMDAWLAWYGLMSRSGWNDIIAESTGLNSRANLLEHAPGLRVLKLTCERERLHARVAGRPAEPWIYKDSLPHREVFIDTFWERFLALPAHGQLNTTRTTPAEAQAAAVQIVEAWRKATASR